MPKAWDETRAPFIQTVSFSQKIIARLFLRF